MCCACLIHTVCPHVVGGEDGLDYIDYRYQMLTLPGRAATLRPQRAVFANR